MIFQTALIKQNT